MSLSVLDAGEGGLVTGILRDDVKDPITGKGTPIPKSKIQTLELTLRDSASGEIVNSRDAQSVLDANGGTVDTTSGAFAWRVSAADTAELDATAEVEERIASFRCSGTFDGSPLLFEHRILCTKGLLLCSFEEVSLYLASRAGAGLSEDERPIVTLMILGLADAIQQIAGRRLRKSTLAHPTVETFSPDGVSGSVELSAWPVDEIVDVRWDDTGAFGPDTILDPSTYYLATESSLRVRSRGGVWRAGDNADCLRVTYTGGLARNTGGVPPALRIASVQQVVSWWQGRDRLGISSLSVAGASITVYSQQPLLPFVADQAKGLRSRTRP